MFENARLSIASAILGRAIGGETLGTVVQTLAQQTAPVRGDAELIASYNTSPWLHAVVNKIASRIAAQPWLLFRRIGGDGKAKWVGDIKELPFEPRQKMIGKLLRTGELEPVTDHLMLDVLNRGNPQMKGSAVRKLSQVYADIKGEWFWLLRRNEAGKPAEAWPIPPHWINHTPTKKKPWFSVESGTMRERFKPEDVLYFRDLNPSDPYGRGTGSGTSLGDEIETDEYASKLIKTHFTNRGKPEMLVAIEGAGQDNLDKMKRKFENDHMGFFKAKRSWWVGGKLTVKELNQTFADMQIVELRGVQRDTVINVYGVPPEQLGIVTNSNRATAHEAERIMATSVLVPRLENNREVYQEDLATQYDDKLIVDYVSPVPDDRLFQLDVMKAAPYNFTRGSWKTLAGDQDRGGGDDVHLVPLNLMEVDAPEPDADASGSHHMRGRKEPKALPAHVAKIFPERAVGEVVEAIDPEALVTETTDLWSGELLSWASEVLSDLQLDAAFDMLNPHVRGHLAEFSSTRIKNINDTTRAAVRRQLSEGVLAGEGIDKIAERIESVMSEASASRAVTIARTEVIHSSGFASTESYRQSGVVMGKQWIVTPDGDRHDSLGYGGAVADIDDDFVMPDGNRAAHPGGFGIAEQDINCRCALAPIVRDADKERGVVIMAQMWKIQEAKRQPWELMARAAFRRGFSKQLRAALQAADRFA